MRAVGLRPPIKYVKNEIRMREEKRLRVGITISEFLVVCYENQRLKC